MVFADNSRTTHESTHLEKFLTLGKSKSKSKGKDKSKSKSKSGGIFVT